MISISDLKNKFLKVIETASSIKDVQVIRIAFLGKNGEITKLSKEIANFSIEEKKTIGAEINNLKQFINEKISEIQEVLENAEINKKLKEEFLDITLPCREEEGGFIHPMSRVQKELEDIFLSMGFAITDGPEIDTDWNCFEGPNIPKNHPARQMQDTFYLNNFVDDAIVLRTHTTTMEIREMSRSEPPFKFVSSGKVFRKEIDATHSPMFHQIEGVYVDENVSLQDLKNCLITFCKKFFNLKEVPLRIRPSYFPFTSPSLEIDMKCRKLDGKLIIGEGNDWMEFVGAGMLHPNVLRNVNIDPEKYQGFAFGFGIDRLLMLKYGVRDIRNLYEGDIRFLRNYGFKIFE